MQVVLDSRNYHKFVHIIEGLSKSHLEFFDKPLMVANHLDQNLLCVKSIPMGDDWGGLVLKRLQKDDLSTDEKNFFSQFSWFKNKHSFLCVTQIIPPSGENLSAIDWEYWASEFHRELYDMMINFSLRENEDYILVVSKDWDLHEASTLGLWPCVSSFDEDKCPEQYVFGFLEFNRENGRQFNHNWSQAGANEGLAFA